ncbi:hypothetical protein [Caulobacter segnis]|uniref:hypothetical protein n=1 Tax=Caulobacter segnis TaxID=88688 RepID=UPI00286758B3|nr:hypothetical protein [Caulobacter segnis]MDR6626406.1 hypothetical protein [Caulobacter segnis]
MKRRRLVWYVAALVLAAAIAAAPHVQQWLTVDACLDGGGAWIKETSRCSHDPAEVARLKSSP